MEVIIVLREAILRSTKGITYSLKLVVQHLHFTSRVDYKEDHFFDWFQLFNVDDFLIWSILIMINVYEISPSVALADTEDYSLEAQLVNLINNTNYVVKFDPTELVSNLINIHHT